MAAYGTQNLLNDKNDAEVVGASETDLPVGIISQLECESSRDMIIEAQVSGVTVATGITLKLQHSVRKDGTFAEPSTTETVAITADGAFEIDVQRVLGTTAALKPFVRMVVTTGAGDAVTFDRLCRTRRIGY